MIEMTARGYPLQKEIQEGIITLLINVALPEGTDQPYAVITTAPGQWLPYCSSDAVTILDVSAMSKELDGVTKSALEWGALQYSVALGTL